VGREVYQFRQLKNGPGNSMLVTKLQTTGNTVLRTRKFLRKCLKAHFITGILVTMNDRRVLP